MKISAHNQLKGTIVDVVKGATRPISASILAAGSSSRPRSPMRPSTNSSWPKGKAAVAVIKASDVMVGVD
jgi:molybdopterin-binding protein